jgi:hypothetical protein
VLTLIRSVLPTLPILNRFLVQTRWGLMLMLCPLLGNFWAHAGRAVTVCSQSDLLAALKNGGVVTLSCDGMITLSNTITISTNVTLDTAGKNVTINGDNTVRLFQVNPGVNLVLKNLTLVNGRSGEISTNSPPGLNGQGGAIYNDRGTVVLVDCTLSSHSALGTDGANGADGSNALSNSSGGKGGNGGGGFGGAIYNNGGTLIVTNSVFAGNRAAGGWGGDGGNGSPVGNGGYGGRGGEAGSGLGGAIYNTVNGVVQLFDSTFSTNQVAGGLGGLGGLGGGGLGLDGTSGLGSPGSGGAIFNAGGTVQVFGSTFLNNSVAGVTGNDAAPGIGSSDGPDGQAGSSASGGALANYGGILALTNCTVFANILVGGNGGNGGDGGGNGFGGDGGDGGGGGGANGAGLYNTDGGLTTVINCTFAENVGRGGSGGAGGKSGGATGRPGDAGTQGNSSGAGIFNQLGRVTLKNTILGRNSTGGNGGGIIEDGGNNLSSDASCAFRLPSSLNDTDPGLGPFGNNGGRTETLALLSTSPAIDAGNDSVAPLADQRHARRAGRSDLGAYEFNGVLPEFFLDVRRANESDVFVSWPISATGLTLEGRGSLTTATWRPITNLPFIVSNRYTLSVPLTNQAQFFRLRKP